MFAMGLETPEFIALITALVVGLTVHEFAHAWSAYQLGDDTAYLQGRLTLDPRSHIDPIGALMMFVAGFGWARPVPINPYTLGRRGVLLVSLAGPVSNLLLALVGALIYRSTAVAAGGGNIISAFSLMFTYLNLLLAVFNMMPIAPLDGWKVLLGLVPPSTAFRLQAFERYGMLVLLLLIFGDRLIPGVNQSIFWMVLGTPVQILLSLFVGAF